MNTSLAMAFVAGAAIWAIAAFWAESGWQPRWGEDFLTWSAAGGLMTFAIGLIATFFVSPSTLLGEGGGATALCLMIISETGMIIGGLARVITALASRKQTSA